MKAIDRADLLITKAQIIGLLGNLPGYDWWKLNSEERFMLMSAEKEIGELLKKDA